MDKTRPTALPPENTDVVGPEAKELNPAEVPLFDRYVVKVDVAISAGAVPTKRPPVGF